MKLRDLEECTKIPSSAPSLDKVTSSKSKKIFKYKDLWFFFTDTKQGITFYSIDLGVQLFHTSKDKTFAMKFLDKNIDALIGLVNGMDK